MTRITHNGSEVVLASVESGVVSAIVHAVLMHQTPGKTFKGGMPLVMGKYFQFLPEGLEDIPGGGNRVMFDPQTGVALGTETYAGFRFIVETQEVEIGKPLPVYAYLPPAKVDEAKKPVSKTAAQRLADREVAQAASAVRKAQKQAEKAVKDEAAKLAKAVKAEAKTVKAENDSKANPKSISANAKAKITGTENGNAVQTKLRALKAKKDAEKALKAKAAEEVAVEIAAGEAAVAITLDPIAEIAGILA